MKIQFYLRFHTEVGQDLYLTGNIPALGNGDRSKAVKLEFINNEFWHGLLEMEAGDARQIQYSYLLKYDDGTVIAEWGRDRIIDMEKDAMDEIQVIDTWNHAGEFENAFFSAPFQKTLLKHHRTASKVKQPKSYTHIFKVKAPLLKKDEALCLCGSGKGLKDWDHSSPVMMSQEGNWWTARVKLPKESLPVSYKYAVYDTRHDKFLQYEGGENRILYGDALKRKITMLHDGFARIPNTTWKGAGVAIPVFSLRSKKSFGVGEFTDLKPLVDWAKKINLKLIQILPVNDTSATHGWLDSYPYAAISAFALHPMYLNLEEMAGKKHADLFKSYRKKQKEFNLLPDLDYEAVMNLKLSFIGELYALQKDDWQDDEGYLHFFELNRHWLVPYSAFCCLRDRYGSCDFSKWKLNSKYNKEAIEKFSAKGTKHYDSIAIQYFTQFHLHRQLRDAADYAHKHDIVIKGDIPIGIYRHSCDAWVEPELYHMDMQAGAPPDDFAIKGQNWGFPTYNWEQMAKDGFAWWKKRFEQMSNYFDAFRIDHILGFFRIWSIPMHAVEGIMGHFDPILPVHVDEFRDRNIWFDHARYTKPFINDAVLWQFFGEEWQFVKEQFLDDHKDGNYSLKKGYQTQREVEYYFTTLEKNEYNDRLCEGLMSLVANRILLEVPGSGGRQFHFRISMENTPSFRYLEWNTQQQLKSLYVDFFYKRQDHFWKEEAMWKLPPLKESTNMLICGEDLGMVPECVPDVMKQLGILSLEIQRMPKDPKREFFHPADAPYLSVITPSTHDMSTIRGWWEEDREKTQRFFNRELGQWGDAPWFCEPWINKAIVIQHLYSPAMWSIFQLQDLLGMSESIRRENPHDERINIPANPKNYWKYRMHMTLEELIHEKDFNDEFKGYIHSSGRDNH